MKLVVFTSALNEEEKIGEMISSIPTQIKGIKEIIKLVVDDGSTDQTANIARENGAMVVSNMFQKRLAYSFQVGIAKALELGADIAVNIDADMQFHPRQIPDMILPILNEGYDFVAADRFTNPQTGEKVRPENMPTGKFYSNLLGSKIMSILTGKQFADVTCGFRAYNRKAMLYLNLNSKYTYTQESFQVLANANLNIKSIPVEVKYFKGRKSRVVNSFLGFLFGSAINILKAFRDYAPIKFFGILGSLMMLPGIVGSFFVFSNYFLTGSFTPYVFVVFISAFLIGSGMILWIVGLMADMLDRIRNNQEKILYLLKDIKYSKK